MKKRKNGGGKVAPVHTVADAETAEAIAEIPDGVNAVAEDNSNVDENETFNGVDEEKSSDVEENSIDGGETAAAHEEYGDAYKEDKISLEAEQQAGFESSSGAQSEIAAAGSRSYGDYLIEEFSVESNVDKVVKYIKIPKKVAQYLLAVLYLVVGALCIAIPKEIESVLPYVVGGAMAAVALVTFVFALVTKEYRNTHTNKTAMSLILIGLSVMIILEHDWAHTFIPIVWGVLGLFEGAHAFNHALSRISRGMRSSYYIIKGVIEVVVAFLLLYKPEQYGELHIIVFGVSLMLDGITTVPIIKNFIARR